MINRYSLSGEEEPYGEYVLWEDVKDIVEWSIARRGALKTLADPANWYGTKEWKAKNVVQT